MSMREELKRIKNEKEAKEAEEKQLAEQRCEQYVKVFEKKQQAMAKFNPMVRRLLNELGLAMWGKGILRRKYQVGQLSKDTTVWIVRNVPIHRSQSLYDDSAWYFRGFFVKLYFDIEGNPSHFSVPSGPGDLKKLLYRCEDGDFGKKVGISESELEMALVECFKVGPMWWDCSDEPPSLI